MGVPPEPARQDNETQVTRRTNVLPPKHHPSGQPSADAAVAARGDGPDPAGLIAAALHSSDASGGPAGPPDADGWAAGVGLGLPGVTGRARRRLTADQQRLLDDFAALSDERRAQLLDFAAFLREREAAAREADTAAPAEPPAPEPIERPAQETVIRAMRRLTATYPMLERAKLLNETSTLMAQHVMQGRDAVSVIDELERVFERHYRAFCEAFVQRRR